MEKHLPARPNLDHLRRQAKALLAALDAREPDAIATFQDHLPAAKRMTAERVLAARFRLADAQSAIARKSGFASWPNLARHVEQLRALEGTWSFARLEIGGTSIPAAGLKMSRLLIDGDRFRTESPEATYEGVFNIDVEAQPHHIDIHFVEGPEAGNWNHGIYRLNGDTLELCLDVNGKPRPAKFTSSGDRGHAYEVLERTSHSRPQNVTGGNERAAEELKTQPAAEECVGFDFVDSPTLARLQGEWTAVKIVRDGMDLPAMMLGTALRSASKNEITISFGGRTMIHALVRLDASVEPMHVDYYNLDGMSKGTIQYGIMKFDDANACFCMASPGDPRPGDFTAPAGSGRTFSQWRPKQRPSK